MDPRRLASRLATVVLGLAVVLVLVLAVGPRFLPYETLTVLSGSMEPTIPVGSEIIDVSVPASTLRQGDVITFPRPGHPGELVTHRILRINLDSAVPIITTRGDANALADPEPLPASGHILRTVAHVPLAGYLVNGIAQPIGRLLLVAAIVLLAIYFVLDLWRGGSNEDSYA